MAVHPMAHGMNPYAMVCGFGADLGSYPRAPLPFWKLAEVATRRRNGINGRLESINSRKRVEGGYLRLPPQPGGGDPRHRVRRETPVLDGSMVQLIRWRRTPCLGVVGPGFGSRLTDFIGMPVA